MAAPDTVTLRLDARRNRDAIVDAAVTLLAERPAASMQEIADAAQVGRTTLYRHFPAREDLVTALFERLFDEGRALIRTVVDEHGAVLDALPVLCAEVVALGARYGFVEAHTELRDKVLDEEDAGKDVLLAYFEKARRRSELRRDLPARWMLAIFRSAATGALHEVNTGRLDAETAGALLGDTLVAAFAPPGRP